MALDSKELQQLAKLLGDVLAPRIREAVAENVTVRIAALAQTLREEQRGALDAVQIETARLVSESTATLSEKICANGVQSTELISASANAAQAFITEQITNLDAKMGTRLSASEESLGTLRKEVVVGWETTGEIFTEVRGAIPTIPAIPEPTKLIEAGELSADMRAAMDLAMRQVMQPMFCAMLTPVVDSVALVMDGLDKHSEAVASVARVAAKDADTLNVRFTNELATLTKSVATKDELATLNDSVAKAIDKARTEVLAEAKDEVESLASMAATATDVDSLAERFGMFATKEDLAAFDSNMVELTNACANTLAGAKKDAEIVAGIARANVDALDIRFTEQLSALAGSVASKEALAALGSDVTQAIDKACTELSTEMESEAKATRTISMDVEMRLDTRFKGELAALAEGVASKDALAALGTEAAEAVAKVRTEMSAELHGEANALTSVIRTVTTELEGRLDTRFTGEIAALAEGVASKEALATLGSNVTEAIVKVHTELSAEVKSEIEAVTSAVRVVSTDIDGLDTRFTGELAALAEGVASKEALATHSSIVADSIVKAHTEAVTSAVRIVSMDIDGLDKRFTDELATLTTRAENAASIEALTALDSRVHGAIFETRTALQAEVSTSVETVAAVARAASVDVVALDKRVAERLTTLTEFAASKDDLKALDSSVADAIVKTRAELLGEAKSAVNALGSETDDRIANLIGKAALLQDSVAEAQHATATVQVQLEAGLQAVRDEAATWGAETNTELKRQPERFALFVADERKAIDAAIGALRVEVHTAGSTTLELIDTNRKAFEAKAGEAQTLIEQVRSEATALVLAEHAEREGGAKEIVDVVAERLIGFRSTLEALEAKQAELATAQASAATTSVEDIKVIAEVVKGATEAVNSMLADMLELIGANKVEQSAVIEGIRTAIETRLAETAASVERSIEHAVQLESGRISQIFIETDATTKQVFAERFETIETSGKELALEIQVVGASVAATATAAEARAADIEARTFEVEARALELAAKADKRIEAAHTRVKDLGSETARNLDAVRAATTANAEAIANQETANRLADVLAATAGEALVARANELDVQIQDVAKQLTGDLTQIRASFATEIESARVQTDSAIREFGGTMLQDQLTREAVSHEKAIELVAGARVEARAGMDALRAEHDTAQARVAAGHSELAVSIEAVGKQVESIAIRVTSETAQLNETIHYEASEISKRLLATTMLVDSALSKADVDVAERFDTLIGRLAATEGNATELRELISETRAQTIIQLEAGLKGLSSEAEAMQGEITKALAELRDASAAQHTGLTTTLTETIERMRLAYAAADEKLNGIRLELGTAADELRAYADTGANTVGIEVHRVAELLTTDFAEKLVAMDVRLAATREATLAATDAIAAEMPDTVKRTVLAFEPSLRLIASDKAATTVNDALPDLLAQAREAAIGAVPAAVVAQTEHLPETLRAALVPLAVAEATRVATEAGERALGAARGLAEGALTEAKAAGVGAIEQARAEATGAARVAALAAAEGLRAELLAALDPTDRISKAVAELMPLEVQDAVRKHVGEVEPRLYIDLAAKIQKEIDRIPRPRDGRDGDAGTHGRDARVAAPVPYEQGKRYEFGQWVAHANGVWVAARNTDEEPVADSADWDCVTPGIKTIESVLQEDGRTVELHFELTNGALHKSTIKMPVQIPRGVFDPEREYDIHDLCTFDGSQWVALKAGKLARPGTDANWKLQVKHGKDGKDLKQPAPQVIRHVGEWQPDTEYPTNVTVDHAGVRWLAMRSTRERPPFTTLVSNDTWTKLGA